MTTTAQHDPQLPICKEGQTMSATQTAISTARRVEDVPEPTYRNGLRLVTHSWGWCAFAAAYFAGAILFAATAAYLFAALAVVCGLGILTGATWAMREELRHATERAEYREKYDALHAEVVADRDNRTAHSTGANA